MENPLEQLAREDHHRRLHELVEFRARAWEEDLGRPPTPEELEQLYHQADDNLQYGRFHRGEIAKAEAELGRELTHEEACELQGHVNRAWKERLGDIS